jgi:hypothetical protein
MKTSLPVMHGGTRAAQGQTGSDSQAIRHVHGSVLHIVHMRVALFYCLND